MKKRKVLEAAAPNIIIIVIIYTIMLLFKLEFIPMLGVIAIIMLLYFKHQEVPFNTGIKKVINMCIFLSVLHLAWEILGIYSIYGLIVYVIIISVLAIWRQKEMITMAIDELELAIYGRQFKKGERRPRLKFVRRKKKDE